VRKRKAAPPAAKNVLISAYLNPALHDTLKRLAAVRKAAKTRTRPTFLKAILEEALQQLAVKVKADADISFVPVAPGGNKQICYRISGAVHRTATQAANMANVQFADFLRTAITCYVRNHAGEIHEEAKAPSHRKRK
jgi:hypothetical protein